MSLAPELSSLSYVELLVVITVLRKTQITLSRSVSTGGDFNITTLADAHVAVGKVMDQWLPDKTQPVNTVTRGWIIFDTSAIN